MLPTPIVLKNDNLYLYIILLIIVFEETAVSEISHKASCIISKLPGIL